MHIKILGTGCPNCQRLETNTKQALEELEIEAQVEKVTDMEKIMGYGIMSLPAIVADGKVLSYGIVPGVDELKKILASHKGSEKKPSVGCSCGSCDCQK